jgi:hypothetical protein
MALAIINDTDDSLGWNVASQTWGRDNIDTFNDRDIALPDNGRWEIIPPPQTDE